MNFIILLFSHFLMQKVDFRIKIYDMNILLVEIILNYNCHEHIEVFKILNASMINYLSFIHFPSNQ